MRKKLRAERQVGMWLCMQEDEEADRYIYRDQRVLKTLDLVGTYSRVI